MTPAESALWPRPPLPSWAPPMAHVTRIPVSGSAPRGPGPPASPGLGRNSQRLFSVCGLSLVPSSQAVSSCSPQLSHLLGDAWGHPKAAVSPLSLPSQAPSWGSGALRTVEKPAPNIWG